MGMMDAYSIVNAGAPGRYGASDANNGGAPGTVADKVNGQMGGHREKALALLGGSYAPQYGGQAYGGNALAGSPPPNALAAGMTDPRQYGPQIGRNMLNVQDFLL